MVGSGQETDCLQARTFTTFAVLDSDWGGVETAEAAIENSAELEIAFGDQQFLHQKAAGTEIASFALSNQDTFGDMSRITVWARRWDQDMCSLGNVRTRIRVVLSDS